MKKIFYKHKHTAECEAGNCPSSCSQGECFIAVSILLAAILIAGAVLYVGKGEFFGTSSSDRARQEVGAENGGAPIDQGANPSIQNVRPVSKDDYIRGNPNAPITIIEYSDLECPFCKNFHNTMNEVIQKYGKNVSWVYRHAPLDQLHSKARKEAEALECAGYVGGNEKFWAYMDRIMQVTPSNNGLDPAELPKIAQYVGLNLSKFNSCFESGKYAKKIQNDLDNAIESGFQGTPYSIILVNGKPVTTIPGALPLSLKGDPSGQKGVSEILDGLLEQL